MRIADQETNDLDKAIAYCRAQGWTENLVIVGATGKRTDHAIGNVYRALAAEVPIVEAEGAFLPVRGKLTFRTWKDAGVSVFAPDPATRMTSRGLRWKLDGVKFANPYCATLNRASSETVTVTSTRPAFVYAARNPAAVRAVVALGSNVGARATYLKRALAALAKLPETRLVDMSAVRETEPVDVPPAFAAQKFLNQAAVFETTLAPLAFSRAMHAIEDRLGRVRTMRNGPRTIDLDLILFGDVRLDTPELTLPHPRAQERAFVLDPLNELGVRLPFVAYGAERGGDGEAEARSSVSGAPSPKQPPCLPTSVISVLSDSNPVCRRGGEAYGVQRGGDGASEARSPNPNGQSLASSPRLPSSIPSALSDSNPVCRREREACGAERGGDGEAEARSSKPNAPSLKQPPRLPSSVTSALCESNPVRRDEAYGVQHGGDGEVEARSSVLGAPSPKQTPCLPPSAPSVLSDSNPVCRREREACGAERGGDGEAETRREKGNYEI